ncbi:hypothetical protein MF672_012395 [Actinomadura sp. ATCC 31491]|uniref:DUF11 domain-containing protein n=1 Tax=Actinomadura luzonensis TaxID=2805427 RepID=A0ABT0FQG1_9ACTN|nr:hypothetical protein [Actinomadura luzonensis]MCK2214584.1 hypothetical protein [Actinomadura luzonensis]
MHKSLAKGAVLAMLASGALLVPAVPASATTATTAATTAKTAAKPYSAFAVQVSATKKVKAGSYIKYKISATNRGPYFASADAWFVGGAFPKGVDPRYIRYSSTGKKMDCMLVSDRGFFCWADKDIKVGASFSVTFYAKTKKSARGTQRAALGVISYNLDQGMEDMDMRELDRLGVPGYLFAKSVKTTVVR